MGLEGGKWDGRAGVWLPWAGWCSFSFCFLLWYGGCALFLGVLYLSIFGVSVCGAPGLAFVGLGARVCWWGVGMCFWGIPVGEEWSLFPSQGVMHLGVISCFRVSKINL